MITATLTIIGKTLASLVFLIIAILGTNEITMKPKHISPIYKVSDVQVCTDQELLVAGVWYKMSDASEKLSRISASDSERLFTVRQFEGVFGIEKTEIEQAFYREVRQQVCPR
ncbi:hypothetical protein [Pseudodesulfovibrio pelocollis]|uniref:hypothetical protein n=1 Tax=Pseudodesulfovibrio pelocollis TaxID=3051432 RepID=UPI00255AEDA7|nr:hypothetical protein [Pseudodesulfovibrio sp. SB368]